MSIEALYPREHSATVQIHMFIDDEPISVGRVGPTYAVLRERRNVEPRMARIVITIDGHEQEQHVYLVDGISEDSLLVNFI